MSGEDCKTGKQALSLSPVTQALSRQRRSGVGSGLSRQLQNYRLNFVNLELANLSSKKTECSARLAKLSTV